MKNFSRSSPHNTSLGEHTSKQRETYTPPSTQYASVADTHGRVTLTWNDVDRGPQTMPAGPECRDVGIERAELIRRGHNYQHRRNYEGFYWCAGTESHIWYESMTEYTSLMYLDHTTELAAVAAQPLCLIFEDGTKHYPDFFAVLWGVMMVVDRRTPLEGTLTNVYTSSPQRVL